jgi:hypothetical protein
MSKRDVWLAGEVLSAPASASTRCDRRAIDHRVCKLRMGRAWSRVVGDHVHRRLERQVLPFRPTRPYRTVGQPARLLHELAGSRALRAQRALVDRRARVALDVDQLASACMDDLPASHRAGGADRLGRLQPGDARPRRQRLPRHRAGTHPPIRGTTDERELSQPLERLRA